MDALTGLREGPRARGAFMIRACFDPPWCVRVADRAPLTIMLMVRGDACIVPDAGDGDRVRLRAGDLAIARGPDPYLCADDPATPPQAVILPGAECAYPDGRPLNGSMDLGVRSWGDRLLDLLVIAALRAWFATREAPAWYRAMADPVVGRAPRLLHDDPAHPWTVAALAGKAGVSRAALARRFHDLVGEPPMAYLTAWRLALAADRLRDTDDTPEAIARRVGHGSAFSLSSAFKRVHGVSPQEHRGRGRDRHRSQT
ncbi:helix-turn-helix transcriptional regulator [Streptomyces torulosus]|uniref:helix-turn-helix transcriptional regulator n=1 Tax=Streptomyces torulosus TaxID=68276 RepID=UPI0006EB2D4E|nr:AraC family transcriptional regulator [Streptomyces torulosus]